MRIEFFKRMTSLILMISMSLIAVACQKKEDIEDPGNNFGSVEVSEENIENDKVAGEQEAQGEQDGQVQSGEVKLGEYLTFGKYEQDGNFDNGAELIEWQVLKIDENKALIISRYILDCKVYHELHEHVTWEECSLRTWLNEDFYNDAFSSEDKLKIKITTNENTGNWTVPGGNDTDDNVFLLSEDEVLNQIDNFASSERVAVPTNYALMMGCVKRESYGGSEGCYWWLRSPGKDSIQALLVDFYGNPSSSIVVDEEPQGVRPALYLDIEAYEND